MLPYLAAAILLICLACSSMGLAAPSVRPPLMLSQIYHASLPVSEYWVSEKLDGVRAYWNGHSLVSRSGRKINAPDWFVRDFPDTPLDGELWIGRGQFALVSGISRKRVPVDSEWQKVKYMVFDLPENPFTFTRRLQILSDLIEQTNIPWLNEVAQYRVTDQSRLYSRLSDIVRSGGEGLMLQHQDAYYQSGRTDRLLKLKVRLDAEARVIDHIGGKGKYKNQLGALVVRTKEGREFKIGTGLSDADRQNPPPIGSWITYEYSGLTAHGLPRFASFKRIRAY